MSIRTVDPDGRHSATADAAATDWGQILRLYDRLLELAPGPVGALNRAVALAELEGLEPAMRLLDGLGLGLIGNPAKRAFLGSGLRLLEEDRE